MSDKLSNLQARLKSLEDKRAKLISGELSASEEEGEDLKVRQAETISRTEKFIREVKAEIVKQTSAQASTVIPTKQKLR